MNHYQRLYEALTAIGPIQSLVAENGCVSFSSAGATPEQEAAMRAAVDSFDWSDEADAAWRQATDRTKAVAALFGDAGTVQVGVRASFRVIGTLLNDVREHVGLPRLDEQTIAGLIVATIQNGGGDPVSSEQASE